MTFFSWLGFTLLMLSVVAGFVCWALRSGQFRRQERARSLPLHSAIPRTNGYGQERKDDASA